MDKKKILEKKLFATCKAAVCGAVLFDGVLFLANFAYETWGRGRESGLLIDIATSLGWLLAIPALALGGVNVYVVDALFGAFLFGVPAFFWQFAIKKYEE